MTSGTELSQFLRVFLPTLSVSNTHSLTNLSNIISFLTRTEAFSLDSYSLFF